MHTVNTHTHSSLNTHLKKRRKKNILKMIQQWTVEVCLHLHLSQQQQHIKLPHICIPKAYTYLHLFSSHLGYVVRKCYDFKTTACCFTLFGDHSVRKNSLWSVRKIETHEQSPIWWDLLNEIGMHENLRVFTAESCQWRHYCTLFFPPTSGWAWASADIHQPPNSLPGQMAL